MLGNGPISDTAICDFGGQILAQSALATTSPLATNVHRPTKTLLAIGTHPTGNYALWSEDLTNAAWANYWAGPTSRTGGQADPFGGTNATQLVLPVSPIGQPPGVFQHPNATDDPTLPLASGTTGTASAWMKGAVGGEQVTLSIDDQGNAATLSLTTSWVRYPYTHLISHSSSWGGGVIGIKNPSTSTGITIYVYGAMIDPAPYLNAYLKTTTAAVTAGAASLVRQMGKIALASASAAASLVRALPRTLSAATSPAATLVRKTLKPLLAIASTASTLVRKTFRAMLASTAPAASLVRQAIKAFLATTAPVASLTRRAGKPLLVNVATATLMVRRISALRPVSIVLAASITKRLSRALLVSVAVVASYTKVRLKAFAAISWVASSLRRSIARRSLSSAAVLGTLKRSTGHCILATAAAAARLVHALVRSLQASAAQTTRLVRTIGKPLKASADRAGILVKSISHHGLTLAPTLARLVRRPAKAFLSAIGVLALLRRRAALPRASSTHPIPTLVRRALLPRVATSATAVRLVRSILVPLVRPVWAFGYAHKGLAAALRAQTAPQARVVKLLRRLVSLSIGVGAILVKRSRPRLPVAVATAAGSLVRLLGVHRLGSAIAIGNLRRTISHRLVIFVHAAGLISKRFPRSMLAAATVAAILRRRTAHLARVSISVLALLPKPLHIKNLVAAVRVSALFSKLQKLIKHPLLFGLFGPPDLKATNAPPQLQADDANPNLTGKIQ